MACCGRLYRLVPAIGLQDGTGTPVQFPYSHEDGIGTPVGFPHLHELPLLGLMAGWRSVCSYSFCTCRCGGRLLEKRVKGKKAVFMTLLIFKMQKQGLYHPTYSSFHLIFHFLFLGSPWPAAKAKKVKERPRVIVLNAAYNHEYEQLHEESWIKSDPCAIKVLGRVSSRHKKSLRVGFALHAGPLVERICVVRCLLGRTPFKHSQIARS